MTKLTFAFPAVLCVAICFSVPSASAQGTGAPQKPAADTSKPQAPPTTSAATAATAPAAPSAFKDHKEQISYALGLNMAKALKQNDLEVDLAELEKGIHDGYSGGKTLMSDEEYVANMKQIQNEVKARGEEKARLATAKNKEFLEANKNNPGVVVLPSGLQYKVLTEGTGPKPVATDTIVCNYRGTLIDGTEFDSSAKSGKPVSFQVNRVIRGWTEALQLMPAGSKWQLFIPSNLAYGERGAGGVIPPNSTLVFEVELVSIETKPEPAQPAQPKP